MHELQEGGPKVDFVVAGVQKGGTQALHHFLSQHPEIGLVSSPKIAPHFFDLDKYFDGTPDYDQYHSWFSADSLARVTGDITPIYSYWQPSIERIKAYNPKMKLIMLLRNPVDRAYSQWNMEFSRADETLPFWRAILMEPFRRRFRQHRIFSYLHRGFYGEQIERVLAHFPARQCLFIKSEDLKSNHEATVKRLFDFLDVDTSLLPPAERVHARSYPRLAAPMRRALTLYFRRDIKKLAQLTGVDFSSWLESPR